MRAVELPQADRRAAGSASAGAAAGAAQLQQSLELWFSATERYAEQLHEMDRAEYVAMKLKEVQRQATVAPPPPG